MDLYYLKMTSLFWQTDTKHCKQIEHAKKQFELLWSKKIFLKEPHNLATYDGS